MTSNYYHVSSILVKIDVSLLYAVDVFSLNCLPVPECMHGLIKHFTFMIHVTILFANIKLYSYYP